MQTSAARPDSLYFLGNCVLEAFDGHEIEEVGAQDLAAESLLLKELQGSEGRPRMAAGRHQSSVPPKIMSVSTYCRNLAYFGSLKYWR